SEKHQVLRPPRAPNGTLHRKGALRAWPFSGLCGVSHPALFQITLVASLLATVLGRCGPPPVLLFASPTMELNQTEFETETVLKYTCRPGYTRSSSVQTLTCNISGRWKYNVFCIKKRCRNPGDLPNGIMEIKTDFFLGSQIEFSCLEGYILVGPSTSVCEIQDKAVDWSAPFPVCEIVKCESPPDISNGKHSGEDEDLYTYGSPGTHSCDPNYSLVGNASISCVVVNKTVGVWSPRPPTCEKIICRQPTIPHAKILSGFGPIYTLKDSIMFSCQKGFVLRGSSVIHCEADNTWSPSPPVCEPSCEVPPSIAHGHYEKVSSYFSSYTFVYKCDEGYKLVGQEKLSCKDSQWLPEAPQCKAQCLKPKIADGKLSVNKPLYVESENITIHCNAGFGVVGSRSITCSGNRTWYPEVPRCEWEVLEGCEQVIAGRKLMQCLSNPAEVQMALEVYKLSLEIELLQLQIDK
ncbi:C4b-binding protein, partial [Heterocephalus glaber]